MADAPDRSIHTFGIPSHDVGPFRFSVESFAECLDELRPLHKAQWDEVAGGRDGQELKADYGTMAAHERAGTFILFTVRLAGRLVGNCALYLHRSTHSGLWVATEDTLYFLPEARRGRLANAFIAYMENVLTALGVSEVRIDVRTVNRVSRLMERCGYRQVAIRYSKLLKGSQP